MKVHLFISIRLIFSLFVILLIQTCSVDLYPLNNTPHYLSINLTPWLNNKAFGGDFDHLGNFFIGSNPFSNKTGFDNIEINDTQTIPIELNQSFGALYCIFSVHQGPITTKVTIHYTDTTQDTTTLTLPDWQDPYLDQLTRYTVQRHPISNGNTAGLISAPIYTNPTKIPYQLIFSQPSRLHLFSIEAYPTQPGLHTLHQRLHNLGTDWDQIGPGHLQIKPSVFSQAKFGIFIHWGLYAVPAWGSPETYAEWYWWYMHQAPEVHAGLFGPDLAYDGFLQWWVPHRFDPAIWLDWIRTAGATYFVFTAKHHDGLALFNTSVSDRSTMKLLFPNRDFVGELMKVAQEDFPDLKRGIYFSLPEWYHPSYKDDSIHWHGPPTNPYTHQRIPYHGSPPIHDFVNQLQVPQLLELINQYRPDIMWCDIGGIHNSSVWQTEFLNQARVTGRQVVMNDRCGTGSLSNFTTVEYRAVEGVPTRDWESTRGIDPYSFGFNRQTRPEAYASVKELVAELIGVVARGGNFLLNVGPEASGEIPAVMTDRLRGIGRWLEGVRPAIFDSVPYWIQSKENEVWFMAHENGRLLYLFLMSESIQSPITITTPLPVRKETQLRFLNGPSHKVQWNLTQGNLVLDIKLSLTNFSEMVVPVIEIKF